MDESFHLAYPHIRERLLPIAEKYDNDNYQVFLKSNDVCTSFAAACRILTLNEDQKEVRWKCSMSNEIKLESIRRFSDGSTLWKTPMKRC